MDSISQIQISDSSEPIETPLPKKSAPRQTLVLRTSLCIGSVAGIWAALSAVQTGNAQNDLAAHEIIRGAYSAEKKLSAFGISKSDRPGARMKLLKAGAYGSAYRYPIKSTLVVLVRRPAGWYVESLDRVEQFPKEPAIRHLTLTAEQRAYLIDLYASGLREGQMASCDLPKEINAQIAAQS
jgi:hypothetical protein